MTTQPINPWIYKNIWEKLIDKMKGGPVYLMTTSNMGISPSSTDLNGLSMEIRNHSMGVVNKFGK